MRLVRYVSDSHAPRIGAVVEGVVIDLAFALSDDVGSSWVMDVMALIEAGRDGSALLQLVASAPDNARKPLRAVRLLAPLIPSIILCAGENYLDHLAEKPGIQRREPEFFLKMPQVVIGPEEPIVYPIVITQKLDYEVELAVVIGRQGRNVSAEQALDLVCGYTIMNDVTARDRQVKLRPDGTAQYALGGSKNFDTSAPLGPVLVTRDEIPDPQALGIRCWVNDELRQDNSTSNMISGVAELVAFISQFVTLQPGFVISTGTPGGTAWGSDPELGGKVPAAVGCSRYLVPGDIVTCEIDTIGVLRNRVVQPP